MYTPNSPGDDYPPRYGAPPQSPYGAPPVQPPPRTPRRASRVPQLTPTQWTLLGGGALTVLGSFLPWTILTFALNHQTIAITGWDTSFGKVTALLGVAALILLALRLFGIKLPEALADRERLILLGLGAEALLLAVLYLLDGVQVLAAGAFASTGPGIGLYLSLIGSLALAIGAYLHKGAGGWLL